VTVTSIVGSDVLMVWPGTKLAMRTSLQAAMIGMRRIARHTIAP
jgi:hypothetical protein